MATPTPDDPAVLLAAYLQAKADGDDAAAAAIRRRFPAAPTALSDAAPSPPPPPPPVSTPDTLVIGGKPYPARPLTPDETAHLAHWLACEPADVPDRLAEAGVDGLVAMLTLMYDVTEADARAFAEEQLAGMGSAEGEQEQQREVEPSDPEEPSS